MPGKKLLVIILLMHRLRQINKIKQNIIFETSFGDQIITARVSILNILIINS